MATQPQVNPNALAAPAEGFGQTVSFAFDPRGEVPMVKPVTSRGPNMGGVSNVAGSTRQDPNAAFTKPPPMDPTAALLMKAGEEVLKAKLDESRTTQFVQGMQRAMSGEAIQEVKESVPWYAKLFGDTPVIEGARAYTAQDTVNRTLAEQAANMDKLQTLDPVAAGDHFNNLIKSSMTGDGATDAIIAKQMAESLPALMKAQAKSHVAYGQKKAAGVMSASMLSGAQGLQQMGEMYADDRISAPDWEVQKKQYLMSVLPPDGINEESYQKTLTTNLQQMALRGQFHAIEAVRESGALAALTPEQAKRVESAVEASARKARDNYAFKFSREFAELKSDAAKPVDSMKPSEISARIDRMNDKFKRTTGSPVDFISSDQKADMLAGTFNAFKAEEDKARQRQQVLNDANATQAAKANAAAALDASITTAVSNGDIGFALKLPGVTKDAVDLKAYQLSTQDPKAGGEVLLNNFIKHGYVNDLAANKFTQDLRMAESSGAPTDGWFRAITVYNQMKGSDGGAAYAAAYFGDYAPRMERASRMLGNNVLENPNAAMIFQASMDRTGQFQPNPLDAKEKAKLVKEVVDKTSGFLPKWLGGYGARPDAIQTVADIATQNLDDWRRAGLSDTEAMERAVASAISGGQVEMLGGFAIRNSSMGKVKAPALRDLMAGGGDGSPYNALPAGSEDDYFKGFIRDSLKLSDLGTTNIARMPDAGGTARFVLTGIDKDGATILKPFSAAQMQEYAAERGKWERLGKGSRAFTNEEVTAWNEDRKRREATPYEPIRTNFGPEITYRPEEGAPSPYAKAADWAAYRAKQQRAAQQPK
jgi:hypothetical protein